MRRIPAVLAVLGLSALTLVGCASAPAAASCERAAQPDAVLDTVEVSGDVGSPAVQLSAPVYVDRTVGRDVTEGDGLAITSDAQDAMFSISIVDGASGATILTSGTQVTPVSNWRTDFNGIAELLMCAREGSRVVGAIPASDMSEAAAAQWSLGTDDAIVVAIDVQKVFLAAANGAPQYNDRGGMPQVVLAPNGRPGLIIPDVAPPTETAIEVLKKGDGAVVTDADSIRVHYTGVTWADQTVFDSTWENGESVAVTFAGVVPGFADALEGQTVGSQILVVIPPDQGYGDEGSGTIPGDATLVFVIDILGIDPPATQ
ncbi:FKBP-type peptidyl-prolyl cis-trans isomerase [Microbacterium sp.]|uniref:FKBP-type peptidyl-prolyl cis-trans isomerase n=1 Tax=Microbacterium sp. TaxID=51671 RepID=UPI0039E4A1CF